MSRGEANSWGRNLFPSLCLALLVTITNATNVKEGDHHEYCNGVITQSNIPGTNLDTLSVIGGGLYVMMALVTLRFIKHTATKAAITREESDCDIKSGLNSPEMDQPVTSMIFPVFVGVLWAQFLISLFTGLIIAFIPLSPGHHNSTGVSVLYAMTWAFQHGVMEGMAVLLQQKGCGWYASLRAMSIVAIYVFCAFWFFFFFFTGDNDTIFSQLGFDLLLLIFYGGLWLLPLHRLFRRPALLTYAKIWFWLRIGGIALHVTLLGPDYFSQWPDCMYYFLRVILFSLVQPLISYHAMYLDSLWWQGVDLIDGTERPSDRFSCVSMDITERPSFGSKKDFSLYNAQAVASVMDRIGIEQNVKMLNFAYLGVRRAQLLGKGSFSTVYVGTYKHQVVAVKRIDTADLTIDIIHRVASEASILSSIQNVNVVGIYGVVILPPSIYIVLELCKYGSLSDVIRPGIAKQSLPLKLSTTDEIWLALGCARGLAAVHAFNSTLCHRDVKSFNFLVDCQFNVKIADLELGDTKGELKKESEALGYLCPCFRPRLAQDSQRLHSNASHSIDRDFTLSSSLLAPVSTRSGSDMVHPDVRDLQPMWLAPEVMRSGRWTQASDVYSLGMVIWEIRSRQYPFEDCRFNIEVHQAVLSGYRHPLPSYSIDSPDAECLEELGELIKSAWSESSALRPSSKRIVSDLEDILYKSCLKAAGAGSKSAVHEMQSRSSVLSDDLSLSERPKSLYHWFQDHQGPWAMIDPHQPFHIRFKSDAWITSMQNIYSIHTTSSASLLTSLPISFADAGFFIPSVDAPAGDLLRGSQSKSYFIEKFNFFLDSISKYRYGHIMLSNDAKSAGNLSTAVEFSLHAFIIDMKPQADVEEVDVKGDTFSNAAATPPVPTAASMPVSPDTPALRKTVTSGAGDMHIATSPVRRRAKRESQPTTLIGIIAVDILETRRGGVRKKTIPYCPPTYATSSPPNQKLEINAMSDEPNPILLRSTSWVKKDSAV